MSLILGLIASASIRGSALWWESGPDGVNACVCAWGVCTGACKGVDITLHKVIERAW